MEKSWKTLGYNQIIEQLKTFAVSRQAREKIETLEPFLAELELRKNLRDTTQARRMLEQIGTPPLPLMEEADVHLEKAVRGELLLPEQIEQMGEFLTAARRLKAYLERGRELQIGAAGYSENLTVLEELCEEIQRSVRNGRVDDYASAALRDIRRQLVLLEEKITAKADKVLQSCKAYVSDSFVVRRNGHLCIPVKKACKTKVPGSVIDKSATGATLFIEPEVVAKLAGEYEMARLEEDSEERRILYELTDKIAEQESAIRENIRVIAWLDFLFAKGKMSLDMDAAEPQINLERRIYLEKARHPMLERDACVPLDFIMEKGTRGVVITGPNTGGKTVAIKTVALLSLMACSGLHIPCQSADIAMNSQVLCDIGDGQNMADNLSTFSAHIGNIISILKKVNEESLVVLDELGSGTDPAEGMGIAVAILDELRRSGALFLVTTHYPEIKEYALKHEEIVNARMTFDRESLRPLYCLEIGKSGESCALYIAKRLGLPANMLQTAALAAYGSQADTIMEKLGGAGETQEFGKRKGLRIKKKTEVKKEAVHGTGFTRGDSVLVLPEKKIGIVVRPANSQGEVLVQIKKEKIMISHKRLKLHVAAEQLYPEDYDFSIIFDSVENRKKRHQMDRKYQEDISIMLEE